MGRKPLGLGRLPGAPVVLMQEGGKEGGKGTFFLSTRVPDTTQDLGAPAKKAPSAAICWWDPTCATHPCFLEKDDSQMESSLLLFSQGPAREPGSWAMDKSGKGVRGHTGPMSQDPVAHQVCGAIPGPVMLSFSREFLSWQGDAAPRVRGGLAGPGVRRLLSLKLRLPCPGGSWGGLSHFLGRGQWPLRLWWQEGGQSFHHRPAPPQVRSRDPDVPTSPGAMRRAAGPRRR